MTTDKAIEALRQYRAKDTQSKQDQVFSSIRQLLDNGDVLSIAAIARAAGVSREFIHSNPLLHAAAKHAAVEAEGIRSKGESTKLAAARGLRADRSTLIAKVEKQAAQLASQKGEIEKLVSQRRLWLGSQLTPPIDPQVHVELRITNNRMMADSIALNRQLQGLRRLVLSLESDLNASRAAHAESVRELTANDPDVVSILRSPS